MEKLYSSLGDNEDFLAKLKSLGYPVNSLNEQPPPSPLASFPSTQVADISEDTVPTKSFPVSPIVPSKTIQQSEPTSITAPSVTDYIKNKYNLNAPDTELADAQEQARQSRIGTGLLQSLSQGLGQVTGAKSSPELYNQINAAANAPVSELQERRKGQAEKLDLQSKMDLNDPSSLKSKMAQSVFRTYAKQAKMPFDENTINNSSANDLEALQKGVLSMAELNEKMDANKIAKQQLHADKQSKEQDTNFQKAVTDLNSVRGNKALQNAQELRRLAQNALSITQNPKWKDNPDAMPRDQKNLLDSELAKIANGGAATQGTISEIQDPTLKSQFASFISKVTNAPVGAGQGKFIQNKIDYLKELDRTAHDMIGQHYQRKLNYWKPKLKSDDFNNFQQSFVGDNPKPMGDPAVSGAPSGSGKSVAKKEYSPSRNQTRITYSDGSQEIQDGQK